MSEKKVLARVGNFQVTGEFGDGHDWISVKAVSGFWTLRFRDDNRMFAFLTQLCSDRDLRPYLECWINANYVMKHLLRTWNIMMFFLRLIRLSKKGRGFGLKGKRRKRAKMRF